MWKETQTPQSCPLTSTFSKSHVHLHSLTQEIIIKKKEDMKELVNTFSVALNWNLNYFDCFNSILLNLYEFYFKMHSILLNIWQFSQGWFKTWGKDKRREFLAVSDGSYWRETRSEHTERGLLSRDGTQSRVGCFPSNSGLRSASRGEGKPGSQGPSSNQITYPRNAQQQQCSLS